MKEKITLVCKNCWRKYEFNVSVPKHITGIDGFGFNRENAFYGYCGHCPKLGNNNTKLIQIDSDIVDRIIALNKAGVETLSSCEGHYNRFGSWKPGIHFILDNRHEAFGKILMYLKQYTELGKTMLARIIYTGHGADILITGYLEDNSKSSVEYSKDVFIDMLDDIIGFLE